MTPTLPVVKHGTLECAVDDPTAQHDQAQHEEPLHVDPDQLNGHQ